MTYFSLRNPIFEVPRARRGNNDKFVAVGVPEAETNANLVLFAFEAVQLYQKLPWTQKSNLFYLFWSAGDAKRLQLAVAIPAVRFVCCHFYTKIAFRLLYKHV